VIVVAHTNHKNEPCVDRLAAASPWSEAFYTTDEPERLANLEQLLAEIDAWPGEPATYDLGSPASS
jgi:hypothetical protein